MTFPSTRRYVASAVVLALAFVALPAPALAAAPGVVVGRVVATDGVTPLSGVVVSLVDKNSQAVFASQPSTERGTFQAQAPAGDGSRSKMKGRCERDERGFGQA